MTFLCYVDSDAVTVGEKYGLHLLSQHPHLLRWLPIAYEYSDFEFKNPSGAVFEINALTKRVVKHTSFSKFIYDTVYYADIENMPDIGDTPYNGLGSVEVASIFFSLLALILYAI